MDEIHVRQCSTCEKNKSSIDYYRYANEKRGYFKNCKNCHNKSRKDFKQTRKVYNKKLTGFARRTPEEQEDIKYMIAVKRSRKDIAEKYNIKYATFSSWVRKGIPEYEGEIKLTEDTK